MIAVPVGKIELDIQRMRLRLVGTTPLLYPYVGTGGLPSGWEPPPHHLSTIVLKKLLVSGARFVGPHPTVMRGAAFVEGKHVPILRSGVPHTDETVGEHTSVVRLGRSGRDTITRALYDPWEVAFSVQYNRAMVTEEQVVTLLTAAGFGSGIGLWRPECCGDHGRFRVELVEGSSPVDLKRSA